MRTNRSKSGFTESTGVGYALEKLVTPVEGAKILRV